jgi:hypothetical protein
MLALLLRASAPQVPSDAWAPTGDMATNRAGSAAALLADGRVLVTGGGDRTAVTSTTRAVQPDGGRFLSPQPCRTRARITARRCSPTAACLSPAA